MATSLQRRITGDLAGLLGWCALTFCAAALGAAASVEAGSFYQSLLRPRWAPPGWLFGPVWTCLYVLMAGAAWHVWRRGRWSGARAALSVFSVHLVANALWSWLFFYWQKGGLAFAGIAVLWCLIVATILLFWRKSRISALLLVPYLAWVTFAGALNWSIWHLNPETLG